MKLTRHNGRAGKNGVYNPKHNDRSFDIANSEHIDEERAKQNLYWDCYNGFRNFKNPEKENELSATFEDVEQLFYRQRYHDFVTGQNERNVKNRHPERNKETGDLLKSKKTCPEETVYQIGTLDNHVPPELLIEIVTEFMEIANERFSSHVHILNWALHLDESTPHIHERHVFDCENQYGEIAPQQEKALEALGFELPEPEKPVGRKNNRKMTFDSACRVLLFDVAKKHGLQLEEEPEYGGRAYLEKQDYILFKQKEQLAAQEQKLEELTMKIEDVEALVDEVADIAYDKAVEVVADTVKLETHKEDIKLVEQSKAWVLSPERKASKKEVEYAVKRLDGVIARITNAMKSTIQKIQTTLMKPEVKKAGTEQIKKKAKNSIIEQLSRKKKEIAEREVSRTDQAKSKKQDDVHGNTTPDDRMVAFLESPTDSYAILQLREDVDDNIPLMFANYSYLQKKEMEPEIDRYEVVYHGSISMSEDVNRQLEDLYVKFNIDHPDDFRGHSMSVSDIVALKVVGEVSFHYVDSVGFQKLENFMKSENYLKNAEMAMEDDYGMIDGIINNGKASGLEERPSVLEQLKEKPVPDVSHKPPKSHPEREIE